MTNGIVCPITGLKKILFATDGSQYSEAALREAVNLSKTCTTKLFVLAVIEVNPEYATLAPQIVEKAEEEMREHLAAVKACAEKEGIDCEVIVHQGEEPYKFIVEEAEKKGVDMIVMGRHGRKGLKRLLMGSVTSRVIGHAPCSVLVVKA